MYTVLGATGNIGSVITNVLLDMGEKVRVVGRDAGNLQPFVSRGAEAFPADVVDEEAMSRALTGRARFSADTAKRRQTIARIRSR